MINSTSVPNLPNAAAVKVEDAKGASPPQEGANLFLLDFLVPVMGGPWAKILLFFDLFLPPPSFLLTGPVVENI